MRHCTFQKAIRQSSQFGILKPCFAETLFISAIGFATLLATSFFPAGVAAITVPSVAMATDPEQLAAGAANPRT